MESTTSNISDYLAILQRRKWPIVLTSSILFAIALTIAFSLDSVYRSTATILVQEQEVPSDLVRSTITSYVDQQIETLKHQVMSRQNLWSIIERFNLYEERRVTATTEEILDQLTKDIHIDVISADVIDKRTKNATKATIAFTLSYDGSTPQQAQKVANELTNLFLAENLKIRERHAQETTAFMRGEAKKLNTHLEKLEKEIALFKEKADNALPELMQLNMQLLNQADRELVEVTRQISAAEERKIYLEGELAILKPQTPMITASGERILDANEQLKALRAQYVSLASYLSPEHPDIIKMKVEISALEKEVGPGQGKAEVMKRLEEERANLATLLERLGPSHPDVERSQQVVQSLEEELHNHQPIHLPIVSVKPENPAYINIQAQLQSTTSNLQSLKQAQATLKKRTAMYAARLERTPRLEPEYLDLVRDRDSSALKYQEMRSRLLEAEVSEGLEVQRKGERFTLIDPPALPEKPEKPNRPAIAFLGLVLAMACGVGAGATAESFDHSIRTSDTIFKLTQHNPLAVIPFLPNHHDRTLRTQKRTWAISLFIGSGVLLLLFIHFLWSPLDVVWFSGLRKLGLT